MTRHVRLLEGPFKKRQAINARFLSMVEPDRLLSAFRTQAGLAPKAPRYGGWESKDITGHGLGHYLSAVARAGMRDRVDYIVDELAACQDSDGYVMTAPKRIFDEVRAGKIEASGFALNGVWVPMYTMHKVVAGLRDAGTPKALDVAHKLLRWLESVLAPLSPEQVQSFLSCEHGGMLEALADLGRVDLAEKYFMHHAVLDPLMRGEDKLDGLHGNTIIPKVVGLARLFELTGKPEYRAAAETFWERVALHRSYCTGGHGDDEHFFPVEKFPEHLSAHACETCNTYNMLKLTRHLHAWHPRSEHMDFVERALINHLAANIGRAPGEYGYFQSLASVATKVFSTPFDSWWCCVGTGMENPTRYDEHIYSVSGDTVRVNLFIGSELSWNGATLRQETRFPEEEIIRFSVSSPRPIRLQLRQPAWCDPIQADHVLKNGDRVELRLGMKERHELLPHSDGKIAAVMKGPLVMAGVIPGAPPAKVRYEDHLKARGKTEDFPPVMVEGAVKPHDVKFVPFYEVYEEPYAVYFPQFNATEWAAREAELRVEQERRKRMEAATIDTVEPGFQQSEVQHDLQYGTDKTGDLFGRKFREGDWFSYRMEVSPEQPMQLQATYWGGQWQKREFDILVDGEKIATQEMQTHRPGEFIEATYPIAAEATAGKKQVTVRLQGNVASVFALRMVRQVS